MQIIFSQAGELSSRSLDIIFFSAEVFKVNEVQLPIIFFMNSAFGIESHCHTQGHLSFVLYSGNFVVRGFAFRSVISFELMLVKGVRSLSGFNFFFFFCMWMSSSMTIIEKNLLHCIAFAPLSKRS